MESPPTTTDWQEKARQLEAQLREVEIFKTALDEHSIVAITNRAGKITYANDLFCQISGYSRQELLGHDHRMLNSGYHPPEFFRQLWKTIASGQTWRGEICNRAKDGSYYWVKTAIRPVLDTQGHPEQYIAIRTDITDRKQYEQQLKNQKKELQLLNHSLQEHVEELRAAEEEISQNYEELQLIHAQLMESEGKFRTVSEQSLLGVGIFRRGRLIYANNAFLEIVELPQATLRQKPIGLWMDWGPENERQVLLQELRRREEGKAGKQTEFLLQKPSLGQDIRYLKVLCNTIFYRGENAVMLTASDVTEAQQAINKLQSARHIIENSSTVLLNFGSEDEGFPVYYASRNIEGLLSVTAEALTRGEVSPFATVSAEDIAEVKATLAAAQKAPGQSQRCLFRLIDGGESSRWVQMDVFREPGQGPDKSNFLAVLNDVTESKAYQEALKESESRFRVLLNSSEAGILLIDRDLVITNFNERAEQMLREVANRTLREDSSLSELLWEEGQQQRAQEYLWAVFEGASFSYEREYQHHNKPEKTVWLDFNLSPVHDEEGFIRAACVTFYDITRTKTSEALLRKNLQEKETLLAEIHHRVKNNLQIISSLIMMQFRKFDKEDFRKELGELRNRIQSMALVHEQLYQASSFSEIDLAAYLPKLAKQVLQSQSTGGVQVVYDLPAHMLVPLDQAIPLGLVVNEALSNCLKHAFPCEKSEDEPKIGLKVQWEKDVGQGWVEVCDNGVGYPEDLANTAHESLGLRLIKILANQLEAETSFENRPEGGGCFRIGFPVEALNGQQKA